MAKSVTRWQRLEEKRNKIRALQLVIGSGLIIAISLFFGFKVLTKMFLFITQINSSGKPVEKADYIPPSPPLFISRLEATNSANLTLRGIAEPGSTIFLTQNIDSFKSVVTTEDGNFSFTQIVLAEGKNEFSAVAVDSSGNRSQPSAVLKVIYSTQEPILVIDSPAPGQIISGNEPKIEITGLTDSDVRLTINERVVIVGTDGRYHYQLGLIPGDNILRFLAVNKEGNQIKKEMTVIYRQ